MSARRVLLALGSLWDLVRFFLVLSLLVLLVRSAGGERSTMVPWLLLAATGNLLIPVGGLMLALFPRRYGNLLGLLRLGKGMSVFAFILLFLSGSLGTAASATVVRIGSLPVSGAHLALMLFVLDATSLVLLMIPAGRSTGPDADQETARKLPAGGAGLPLAGAGLPRASAGLPRAGLADTEMKDFTRW
jgi:hypothetical protein